MFNLKCKRYLVVVGVVLICCINFIHLARADTLEVQQYIENTKAYIKEIFFTEDGLLNGTSKVHIDGGSGSIGIGSSFGNAGVDLPEDSLVVENRAGIGTDSPSLELDVIGAGEITDDLTVDAGTLYVDSNSNNVGIGTKSPDVKLDIRDDVKAYAVLGGGDEAGYGLETDGTEQWRMYTNSSDGDLEFALNDGSDNYETFVNFTKEGKVGIGSKEVGPDTKVRVKDKNNEINIKTRDNNDNTGIDIWNKNEFGEGYINFIIGSSDDYDGRIFYSKDSNYGDGGLGFLGGNNGDGDMFIDTEGRVGIGTIEPSTRLDVYGNAKFGGEYEVKGEKSSYTIALDSLSAQRGALDRQRLTYNAYWDEWTTDGSVEGAWFRREEGKGLSAVMVGNLMNGDKDGRFYVLTKPENGDIDPGNMNNFGIIQDHNGKVGIGRTLRDNRLSVDGGMESDGFCFSEEQGCLHIYGETDLPSGNNNDGECDSAGYWTNGNLMTYKLGNSDGSLDSDPGKNWDDAKNYCNNLGTCYNDWRLPTRNELNILYNNKEDIGGYGDPSGNGYWSSDTTTVGGTEVAYEFDLGDGSQYTNDKGDTSLVRCVRGGSQSCEIDEELSNGYYVVNDNTDSDGDGVAEGCNEDCLSNANEKCILYITASDFYVAPGSSDKENIYQWNNSGLEDSICDNDNGGYNTTCEEIKDHYDSSDAVGYCNNLNMAGLNWYLPPVGGVSNKNHSVSQGIGGLADIYLQKNKLRSIQSKGYWSSSYADGDYGGKASWRQRDMGNGDAAWPDARERYDNNYNVRCIAKKSKSCDDEGYYCYNGPTGKEQMTYNPYEVDGLSEDPEKEWGCVNNYLGANSSSDGENNTNTIISNCNEDNAANFCKNLNIGGHNDWYLPSKEELYEMNTQGVVVGTKPSTVWWWSSTESGSSTAKSVYGDITNWHDKSKSSSYYVRCIRSVEN